MPEQMTTALKVTRARTALITAQPFFGALLLQLKTELVPGLGTACTDGEFLRLDPEFIDGLPEDQVQGVLAHEAAHLSLKHPWRRGERDLGLFNVAADHAVNHILHDAKISLPKGVLRDPEFRDKSAEEIYAILRDRQPPPSPNSPSGEQKKGRAVDPGGCGGFVTPAAASPAEAAAQESKWDIATMQAIAVAKAAGQLPAHLERAVRDAMEPEIDVETLLRRFLSNAVPGDYAWTPPNRRHVYEGIYLPSMVPNKLAHVSVMIDTSGSVNERTLNRFAAILRAVCEDYGPQKVSVIYCDAAVQRVDEFSAGEPVEIHAKGGGGTDFRPPFAWLDEQGETPDTALFLTDLDCTKFPEDPGYPVMWLTVGKTEAPFGEVLEFPKG